MNETACADPVTRSLIDWVIAVTLGRPAEGVASSCFDDMQLEHLVLRLLDMDFDDARKVSSLVGFDAPFEQTPRSFNETLQQALKQLRLFKLFARTRDGEEHRSICPAAFNERTGEHRPEEMARWRADFRSMSPEQQMMAATIVWMYRSGPDSIWLRRVPCTWRASEALHYMRDTGCLAVWLQLVARYPGW